MLKTKVLSYELGAIFFVKILLLYILWSCSFSHPIDTHDTQKMSQKVSAHFLNYSPSSSLKKINTIIYVKYTGGF